MSWSMTKPIQYNDKEDAELNDWYMWKFSEFKQAWNIVGKWVDEFHFFISVCYPNNLVELVCR